MLVELPAFPNALPSDAEICRRIAEWETPGFQNEPPSDTELLRDIARFLVDSYV